MAFAVSEWISGKDAVTGKEVSVSLKKIEKATVVLFLSTRCPCSASHQSSLNDLKTEFEKKGFQFVGVHSNANESWSEANDYFKKSKLTFPVIHDPESKIADEYKAYKTPHSYVINPTLDILFQGGVDNSKLVNYATEFFLKDALAEIERGRLPKKENVRVVGCEIARP